MEAFDAFMGSLPWWIVLPGGFVLGVTCFIALTSNNSKKWWSAHRLGQRDNIAWILLLAFGFILVKEGVIPILSEVERLEPFMFVIGQNLPGCGAGLVGLAAAGLMLWHKFSRKEESVDDQPVPAAIVFPKRQQRRATSSDEELFENPYPGSEENS